MVSTDTARIGIIRRAKNPQTPPIIRYRDVRPIVCAYLSDPQRSVNPLIAAEEMFRQRSQDPAESSLRQDDARHSIEVLRALRRMANQLNAFEFHPAAQTQAKVHLGGVEISVRADVMVHASPRGQLQIGAGVLRLSQDDAETDTARAKRREMGVYVATLARFHIDQNFGETGRSPSNRLCLSIDIQHGEIFQAPEANTRRMNDLENACRFIAAMWDSV